MIVGPIQFDQPLWLLLAPASWALAWWMGRRSLSGLSGVRRRVVWGLRFAVLGLLAAAIAEPEMRRVGRDLSVIVVVDTSRSMPPGVNDALKRYLERAAEGANPGDRMAVVTAAEKAFAQSLPSDRVRASDRAAALKPEDWNTGGREGTDLAAGVRMALAVKPEDTAARVVLFSDGNETAGSLVSAARAARAAGAPIDVLPMPFEIEREVVFESIAAPATARVGQTVNVRFVLTSTKAAKGRVSLLANGRVVPLGEGGSSLPVSLEAGRNVITAQVTLSEPRPQSFEAVFEPSEAGSDTIAQNNRAMAATFVSSEARVLVLASGAEAAGPIARALAEAKIDAEVRASSGGWQASEELRGYDAVVLVDTPAYDFSQRQMEELASYVHDSGGGLVMVGGPNSFGAGGWINTPVADALPVRLDPPQKRQIPRGALALVMHSCEMPDGNYWGMKTAEAAANALSRLDLLGIIEYGWQAGGTGASWAYPLSEVGDGKGVRRALQGLQFGDMPDFTPLMEEALDALVKAKASAKHVVIVSDGDPQAPPAALVQKFIDNKVSVSAVLVFPHTFYGPEFQRLQNIATRTGGRMYSVTKAGDTGALPQIFIKEAQTARRALIWEGDPITPVVVNAAAESMRGVSGGLPPITGYVVTGDREGLALTTVRSPEGDPIAAQMQHGLGRSVAFTSDAAPRWSTAWMGWAQYRAFWEQQVRWAMRPTGSANVSVTTLSEGAKTRVIVTALDAGGESLNFARFRGRVTRPDLSAGDVELRQTGPGRYEGEFDSGAAGTYLASLRYDVAREGRVESGVAQASVSRPFSDEYRALKDNAALLRQAAEASGGRVLDGTTPENTPLFSREGLTPPVALRPIWLPTALLAMALFVADVASRRLAVDLAAMRRRLARRAEARPVSEEQVGALRAARERAQGAIAAKASEEKRAAKFEATQEERAAAGGPVVDGPRAPVMFEKPKAAEDGDAGGAGISRLRRAKQRARDEMDDQGNQGQGG